LWTFQGRILVAEEGLDTEPLRVAVTWLTEYDLEQGVAEAYQAQDLELRSLSDTRYAVEMFAPPPLAALHPASELIGGEVPDELAAALGFFLVFNDRNGNQALDMLPADAVDPIDIVLGPAEAYYLYHLEGPVPGSWDMQPGPNLYEWVAEDQLRPVPLQDEVFFTLWDTPELQYRMCAQAPPFREGGTEEQAVPPDQVPAGAAVRCSLDGHFLEYSYQTIRQEGGVCSEIVVVTIHVTSSIPPAQPLPSTWPCRGP
jgi:hypothetical protein